MKTYFNQMSCRDSCKQLENLIRTLMARVAKLAPHPSRPNYNGALFISGTESFKPAAEYDGMGGAMMMESMIANEFVSDLMDAGDAVSMILSDSKKPLRHVFNIKSSENQALQAYYKDLSARIKLESWIAVCLRELYATYQYAVDYRGPVFA